MDETRRGRVIGLWESGVSVSAIAAEVDISLSTAKRWIEKFRVGGIAGLQNHRRGNGAARQTTAVEDQAIVAQVRADPFQAATIVCLTVGVAASPWIVRARLKEAGLKCRRAAKMMDLTNRH
ncbi:uncharacterized protein LOC125501903 [Athalia rosae]|uniref:uncharacterized protein LOC125501903 n=1 Tax=Athalia rosae TaxID=37344 RepID=UPI002033F261|nr:uncharacterized protein LOC125501903 [Athalia rosae]